MAKRQTNNQKLQSEISRLERVVEGYQAQLIRVWNLLHEISRDSQRLTDRGVRLIIKKKISEFCSNDPMWEKIRLPGEND